MKTPLLVALLALCGCSESPVPDDALSINRQDLGEKYHKGHVYVYFYEGGVCHAAHCPCFTNNAIEKAAQAEIESEARIEKMRGHVFHFRDERIDKSSLIPMDQFNGHTVVDDYQEIEVRGLGPFYHRNPVKDVKSINRFTLLTINRDIPWLMPCGETFKFTLHTDASKDIPCPCGDTNHWVLRWEGK